MGEMLWHESVMGSLFGKCLVILSHLPPMSNENNALFLKNVDKMLNANLSPIVFNEQFDKYFEQKIMLQLHIRTRGERENIKKTVLIFKDYYAKYYVSQNSENVKYFKICKVFQIPYLEMNGYGQITLDYAPLY